MKNKEYEAIINRTVPSRQMREFLCLPENMLNCFVLAEIIVGSPEITIGEKYELLCSLAEKSGDGEIKKSVADFKAAIDNLALTPGEIFTVDDLWYDDDIEEVNYSGWCQPCADYQKVIDCINWNEEFEDRYINREKVFEETDAERNTWYKIKKWIPDENGIYIENYVYYYIYGLGICWFSACRELKNEGPYMRFPDGKYSSDCVHLNLPTPFKPGDIVRIDCRPFAPPVNALIVYAGPDWDCCSLLALFRDKDGHYQTRAVKHTDMYIDLTGDNMISALYRIGTYDGKLNKYDRIYKEISPLIYGDNKKGDDVWELVSENRGISSPDELLEKVKELF